MELKVARKGDSELWNRIVQESPHGTLFHTWEWLGAVEKQTGSMLYPLLGIKGESPLALMPVFLKKIRFANLALSPPSRALQLYMGPIFADYYGLKQGKRESYYSEFIREANMFFASDLKCNFVRIRTPPGLIDARPFLWTGYKVEPLYTYMINLRGGVDNVWENFNKQLRVDINKTKNDGVEIKEGSMDDLEFLRTSVAERFVEQGVKTPTSYKAYLSDVYKRFHPHNFRIFVARYKGKNVGGLTLLCYKKRASLWMGIPKSTVKGIYPNELATWEAIRWACGNGYEEFEIMDAGDDPRLRHFKSKFNPDIVPWFSAEKYSSFLYKSLENVARKVRLGIR